MCFLVTSCEEAESGEVLAEDPKEDASKVEEKKGEASDDVKAGEKREATGEEAGEHPGQPSAASAGAQSTSGHTPLKAASDVTSLQGLSSAEKREKLASRALKVFIAGFRSSGATPPCRSFRSLITMEEFTPYFVKFESATSEADLKAVAESTKAFKSALNDLTTMTRNASTALRNAMKQAHGKADKKGAKKNQSAGLIDPSTARLALFERGVEKGQAVSIKDISEKGFVQMTTLESPIVVKGFEQSDLEMLGTCAQAFVPKFQASKLTGPSQGKAYIFQASASSFPQPFGNVSHFLSLGVYQKTWCLAAWM